MDKTKDAHTHHCNNSRCWFRSHCHRIVSVVLPLSCSTNPQYEYLVSTLILLRSIFNKGKVHYHDRIILWANRARGDMKELSARLEMHYSSHLYTPEISYTYLQYFIREKHKCIHHCFWYLIKLRDCTHSSVKRI